MILIVNFEGSNSKAKLPQDKHNLKSLLKLASNKEPISYFSVSGKSMKIFVESEKRAYSMYRGINNTLNDKKPLTEIINNISYHIKKTYDHKVLNTFYYEGNELNELNKDQLKQNISISQVILIGFSRGSILAYKVGSLLSLDNKNDHIPISVIAREPVPGNTSYTANHKNSVAKNVSDVILSRLCSVTTILGDHYKTAGKNLDESLGFRQIIPNNSLFNINHCLVISHRKSHLGGESEEHDLINYSLASLLNIQDDENFKNMKIETKNKIKKALVNHTSTSVHYNNQIYYLPSMINPASYFYKIQELFSLLVKIKKKEITKNTIKDFDISPIKKEFENFINTSSENDNVKISSNTFSAFYEEINHLSQNNRLSHNSTNYIQQYRNRASLAVSTLSSPKNSSEDLIKAYNKTKINDRYLYNCYLELSIKNDSALSSYFSKLDLGLKAIEDNSIFFSVLKFTGRAFYKKASPYYEKYSQVKRIQNQNLPIICYNKETQNQIQNYVFEAEKPLDINFNKIIVNKISLGDFACMEFAFTNYLNSSEALKKYYSKENGKPISIIVATSSFINLINKEYRFHIEKIPHLMKMFKNHQAQRSVNNEDLIEAFLQNAKEKEDYPVYKGILISIKDLKGSEDTKDKKILNYLKKNIDISSSSSRVIQVKNKLQNDRNLTALSEKVKNETSPVEVARAISEEYAVCNDEPLKISLAEYLNELGFSLEEFSSSSNVFSRITNILELYLSKESTNKSNEVFILKATYLKFISSKFQMKIESLYNGKEFSIKDVNEILRSLLKIEGFDNKISHIDDNYAPQEVGKLFYFLKNVFAEILFTQYQNLIGKDPFKTCLEKCFHTLGIDHPKHFETMYQNGNIFPSKKTIELINKQKKDGATTLAWKNAIESVNINQKTFTYLCENYNNLPENLKYKIAKLMPIWDKKFKDTAQNPTFKK